jgi:plasmid maintenance system killer protein
VRIEVRPAFDETVMASEPPIRKAAAKMLQLLQALDLPQLWSHPGLNFEKLHGMIEPTTREQLYSLRVNGAVRAIAYLCKGPTVVLVSLHVQHDKAYRK